MIWSICYYENMFAPKKLMRLLFATIMTIAITTNVFAQQAADKIIGRYVNEDNTRKIEVYKEGEYYWGKLVWINESGTKVKAGELVLKKIKYTGKDWTGYIYLPAKNKTLDGVFIVDKNNNLHITADAGMTSKTKIWKRTNQ